MRLIPMAGALALAASLAACSTVGAGPSGGDWAAAAKEIATSTTCGHTDVVDIMVGVVSSGHVHLERDCPTPPAAVTPPAAPQ